MRRCGVLREMSHVAWSVFLSVCLCVRVCMCVLVTLMYCATTAEPIEMSFGDDSCGPKERGTRWRSRSDESICSRKGWQVGDAAFCQIIMGTWLSVNLWHVLCIYCHACGDAILVSPHGIAMLNGLYSPLWFLFLLLSSSFFDAQFLRSLNGSQPNLDTYWEPTIQCRLHWCKDVNSNATNVTVNITKGDHSQ